MISSEGSLVLFLPSDVSGDNQTESWDSSAGYIRSESFLKKSW